VKRPASFKASERDAGHGSLFQFHESFIRQAAAFLGSKSVFAPY
jgi:hypothetical protein